MNCQSHVRSAFSEWLEAVEAGQAGIGDDELESGGETFSIPDLLKRLYRCTDILPGSIYRWLELEGSQTYAAAVRHIRQLRQA
jgi:hypothetical protein